MKKIFTEIWTILVEYYTIYSDFIHSILPGQLGDLLEGLLDIVVVIIIVKMVASFAFGTKTGEI